MISTTNEPFQNAFIALVFFILEYFPNSEWPTVKHKPSRIDFGTLPTDNGESESYQRYILDWAEPKTILETTGKETKTESSQRHFQHIFITQA